MCNVKENADVKTKADLQNLVTSVLLRQTDDFTLEDIIQGANARLIGSSYYDSEELKARCADTLETFFGFNGIQRVAKGKYTLSLSWPAISGR